MFPKTRMANGLTVMVLGLLLLPAWSQDVEERGESKTKSQTDAAQTPPQTGGAEFERPAQPKKEDEPTEVPRRRIRRQELAPDSAPQPLAPASEISFSFHDAEWKDVFKWLAELSGRSLYIESMPPDKFTYFDRRKYSFAGALSIINQALFSKGFVVLTPENFLRVVKLEKNKGIPPDWIELIDIADLPSRGDFEFVRVRVPLEGIAAEDAKKEYEPLKSEFGAIVALPGTNQLLVVDRVNVVRQIVDLMRGKGSATLRAFPLRFIGVMEAAETVRDILGIVPPSAIPGMAGMQPGGNRGDFRGRFREMVMNMPMGGPPMMQGGQPQQQPQQPQPTAAASQGPFISVSEKTNTLFVKATPDKLAVVAEVIKAIDVPEAADRSNVSASTPRFEAYEVEPGTAEGIATALDQTLFDRSPQAKVAAHPNGGRILVYASPQEQQDVRDFLKQLQTEGMLFEVIPLRALDAAATATIVKSVLGLKKTNQDEDDGYPFFFYYSRRQEQKEPPMSRISVEADVQQNQLVIRGTRIQIDDIKDLLRKMGEPIPTETGRGGSYRVLPLGDDREALQRALDKLRESWPQLKQNPIQIENLDDSSRSSRPAEKPPAEKKPSKKTNPPKSSTSASARDAEAIQFVADQEDEKPEPPPERAEESRPKRSPSAEGNRDDTTGAPIHVVIDAQGTVHMYSEDTAALDAFENLLRAYSGVRAGRATGLLIKIYYLKAADAQDAAYMLEDVLYETSSSRNRVPFFFGGRSRSDEEELPRARIVPDLRTNSLMVIGPPSEHRKIEQLLEYIDREDPPEAGVFGEPQLIKLQYAKAKDVAEVLKQVFAARVFVQPQQGPQGQQGGPQSFFPFGGGSSRRGGSRGEGDPGKGKVFIGIDERSNSIVVLAQKAMYGDIESLVKQLDEEARQHRRVSRVVTLRNAKPETVEKAMGTLFNAKTSESEKKKEEAAKKEQKKEGEGEPRPDRERFRERAGPRFFFD
jgi:type II secretory pathway component GspD/PulD (secretin)